MKTKPKDAFNMVSTSGSVELAQLKPAQMTVGMRQVQQKQKHLRRLAKRPGELVEFILKRPILVVYGPPMDKRTSQKSVYVFDHNHLALALLREKYETAPVKVEGDFSTYTLKGFWRKMQSLHLVHPCDADGHLQPISKLPKKLTDLKDDPYRSLAAFVREDGGFKKSEIPFAEFMWADYFRECISKKLVTKSFNKAMKKAHKLAHEPEAKHLPGYVRRGLKSKK